MNNIILGSKKNYIFNNNKDRVQIVFIDCKKYWDVTNHCLLQKEIVDFESSSNQKYEIQYWTTDDGNQCEPVKKIATRSKQKLWKIFRFYGKKYKYI